MNSRESKKLKEKIELEMDELKSFNLTNFSCPNYFKSWEVS